MSVGYVKMYRALADSDLWLAEPFTKGQAWADLILNANFRDRTTHIAGQQIPVNRGQLAWSEVTLTKRWRWSRGKVRRFLNLLKTDGKIEQHSVQHTSIITICNYEKFQTSDTADGTPDNTPNDTPGSTPDGTQEEKGKKVKNDKKGKTTAHTLPDDFQITSEMREWADDKNLTINLDLCTEKWKNSMIAKGNQYKNWVAAWRNGMLLAEDWSQRDAKNVHQFPRQNQHQGQPRPRKKPQMFPGIQHDYPPTGTGGDQ